MLRPKIYQKLVKFVDEEKHKNTNLQLLKELEEKATENLLYWDMTAENRNAINTFVLEIKDILMKEAFSGQYSFDTMLEAMLVTMLEVGWKTSPQDKIKEEED